MQFTVNTSGRILSGISPCMHHAVIDIYLHGKIYVYSYIGSCIHSYMYILA